MGSAGIASFRMADRGTRGSRSGVLLARASGGGGRVPVVESAHVTANASTAVKVADQQDAVGGTTTIVNSGAVTIYLGGPSVTAATGFDVAAAGQWQGVIEEGGQMFAIAASSTAVLKVLGPGAVQLADPRSPGVLG